MKKKVKMNGHSTPAGREIIAALTDLRNTLAAGSKLEDKYVVHKVKVPEPTSYDAKSVKMTRAKLGVSQRVFAKLVGVSAILAQSWEQGKRTPNPLACRLLDEINRDPAHWTGMLQA